ncbi:hypothetical protein ASPBRDRAFT_417666 [Aspergillus brasiliensis CBS 101740]|uniref:Uncharacterized protein n=1 Tax=Aspergillus brasiliensis (strain CBS 101740 / IMI 381727 / IBT 21946) TaxID=767769 RepID=A0A1L9U486_ASPBC|nr:hypothetical protein ASPBRDRAFT_417666 [Aspergillus brasiliensis CBS 101740]
MFLSLLFFFFFLISFFVTCICLQRQHYLRNQMKYKDLRGLRDQSRRYRRFQSEAEWPSKKRKSYKSYR